MKLTEQINATPIQAEKSVRRNEVRVQTSCLAGKIVPVAYVPLLREDRVSRGKLRIRLEMAETAETLMNGINVTCYAHFIPFLAFERFEGSLDRMNRAYKGVPDKEGGDIVPFFEQMNYNRTDEIINVMGLHRKTGATLNSAVVESYNVLVNYRRKARSVKLPTRTKNDTSLAAAFWHHSNMRHIVPDFDQAMMDGELDLNIVNAALPVRGIGTAPGASYTSSSKRQTGGVSITDNYNAAGGTYIAEDPDNPGFPAIYAELQEQGVTLSLSNIEMAKKTAAFAQLRKNYAGLDDDHIIDLLMESIRVPDAQLSQPILLDRKSTLIGYNRRFATDAANLEKSVTTGETFVEMSVRTPAMNTGGIILFTTEIVPEQLFERQNDYFLDAATVDDLPSFTRDFLDPEKVSIVPNKHVDVEHSLPDGTFGYAPLNHQWQRSLVNVGGKYMRAVGDPFDEDRQKIWAVETVDPALTSDFYLVNNLHHNVFADQTADPFDITAIGVAEIVGNTVFGKGLTENTSDYQALKDQVDDTRIDQTA